jgi:hypothetical protein
LRGSSFVSPSVQSSSGKGLYVSTSVERSSRAGSGADDTVSEATSIGSSPLGKRAHLGPQIVVGNTFTVVSGCSGSDRGSALSGFKSGGGSLEHSNGQDRLRLSVGVKMCIGGGQAVMVRDPISVIVSGESVNRENRSNEKSDSHSQRDE